LAWLLSQAITWFATDRNVQQIKSMHIISLVIGIIIATIVCSFRVSGPVVLVNYTNTFENNIFSCLILIYLSCMCNRKLRAEYD